MITHEPVLVKEVLTYLDPAQFAHLNKRVTLIDATVGFGGHAKEFVKRNTFVVGIDTDERTLEFAIKNLKNACPGPNLPVGDSFKLLHGNFKDIDSLVSKNAITDVYAILIDLGVSTPQLTSENRGLSFTNRKAELDMRLDTESSQIRGSDLLNALSESQLFELFKNVVGYAESKRLSKNIVRERSFSKIETVGDFLDIIEKDQHVSHTKKVHPATLAFMALRMAVNSELENIKEGLPRAFAVLEKKGRLAVISFHSGEDRLVKQFMKEKEGYGFGKILTEKPIVPSIEEIEKNPKSRSAKLRVIEKI